MLVAAGAGPLWWVLVMVVCAWLLFVQNDGAGCYLLLLLLVVCGGCWSWLLDLLFVVVVGVVHFGGCGC